MLLFNIIVQLCVMFPALDPITIRSFEAIEVIRLIQRVMSKKKIQEITPTKKKVYADQVSWF